MTAKDILAGQIEDFREQLQKVNKKRRIPRYEEDYSYLQHFFNRVIADRNKRADEIDAPEFQEAVTIAKKLLPYPTCLENCMDGRLLRAAIGLYGQIGDVLSVAGGILYEFVRDENQKMHLIPDSKFGQLLKKALKNNDSIVEVIDSHIGCAARAGEELAKGKYPKDNGLLTDVLQKMEMGRAMQEYADDVFDGKKKIVRINISTDPHDGFMYMGLTTEPALVYAIKHKGYTQDVLDYLTDEGLIISTRQISEIPAIEKVFEKYAFPIDITHKYAESGILTWRHIDKMKDAVLPIIYEKLEKVYPKRHPKKELEERAILILVNAFTGFLHKKFYKQYPYAEHHEEGVLVAKGNTPPYEISLFGESSLDMNNLPSNINLAASIVRNNRKVKRVVDVSGVFKDTDTFVTAPVGVIMQVKVLDELPPEEWEKLLKIKWSDLEDVAWESMDDMTFLNFLEDKAGNLPLCVANAINKLRKRVAILYDMDEALAGRLIDHDIVVLPMISDVSKRVRCIIPFLKTGFLS